MTAGVEAADAKGPGVVLALDAGGTVLKGALVDRSGGVLARRRADTAAGDGAGALLGRVESLLAGLAADASSRRAPVRAVGVAFPGLVDEAAGTVAFSANLGLRDEPVRARLERALPWHVAVSQDVRAAARAELVLGAGRGASAFLFVAIGTGIAAATVLGGRAVTGAHGLAGEIGHVGVDPGGEPCGCGRRGCLETVASASALARRYSARRGAAPGPPLRAEAVLAAAADGDPAAAAVLDEAVTALAGVLVTCQSLLDVEVVVLGGGLAKAGAALTGPLAGALAAGCGTVVRPPQLVVGRLGDDAGCVGAALSAWDAATQHLTVAPR